MSVEKNKSLEFNSCILSITSKAILTHISTLQGAWRPGQMRLQRMGILIAYHKALKSTRHVLSFYWVLVSGEKPPWVWIVDKCTSVSICRLHLDHLTCYIAYLGCLVFQFRNNIVGNKMCHGIYWKAPKMIITIILTKLATYHVKCFIKR